MEKFIERFIDIIANDTIHQNDINHSFHNAIVKNYQTILTEQHALCGVTKHQFKLADMKMVSRIDKSQPHMNRQSVVEFSRIIPETLINYNNRFSFFSRDMDDRTFTQEELTEPQYSNIFERNYLVFIQGYFIGGTKVLMDDNDTTVIIPVSNDDSGSITADIYNQFIAEDAVVTVYLVPNYEIKNVILSKAALDRAKWFLTSSNMPDIGFNENTLVFINTLNDVGNFKELADYMLHDNEGGSILIDSNWLVEHELIRNHITVINLPKFHLVRDIEFSINNQPYFQVPNLDILIPSDNVMVIPFAKHIPVEPTDISKASFTLHYPNIYKFTYSGTESWDGTGFLGYFHDNSELAEYDDKLWLFHKYVKDVIGAYNNEDLSTYVKDYMPLDVKYYNEIYTDTIHAPYTFAYKVDKFHDYTEVDSDMLIDYLYTKLKGKMRHYVYMNKLNLESRVRMDNSQERIPYNLDHETFGDNFQEAIFSEPHYVFSLSNAIFGLNEEFRFHLDNIALMPDEYYFQDDVDWYHVYIPCRRVTSDSILEIEKFPKVEDTIYFEPEVTESGTFELVVPEEYSHIYMNQIHFYNTETMDYLLPDDYQISIYNETLQDYVTLTNGSRASITGKANIRIMSATHIGKKLGLYIKTAPVHGRFDNDGGGWDHVRNLVNMTPENLRIYKNGLYLNNEIYLELKYNDPGKFNGDTIVGINIARLYGDVLGYDILPFANKREYFVQGEFCDEKGFVDTGNNLSLPIDLKWYDVYVNGRKLNKSNIEILSPNKFFVKGIDSRKNIEIWLRGDAPQEFEFKAHNSTINDIIWVRDPFIKQAIIDSQDLLDDSLDDIYDEFEINVVDQYLDYVKFFLKNTFINPNEQQLTPTIKKNYPDLFNEYDIMWLDSNTYTDAYFVTHINSNNRGGENDDMNTNQYRYGFTPMHIGSHDDALPGEYMCDPVTGLPGIKDVSDETIIPGGSINRVVTHKLRFMDALENSNMPRADIYQLQFDGNIMSKVVTPGVNLLDSDDITLVDVGETTPNKVSVSLDLDILYPDDQNVMQLTKIDPIISVTYYYYNDTTSFMEFQNVPLSALNRTVLTPMNPDGTLTQFHLTDIHVVTQPDNASDLDVSKMKMILHSVLVAF